MKTNEASWDRIVRVVLAAALFYLYFAGMVSGVLGVVFLVLGIVFLVTGIVGFCPLYALIKVSTKK